MKVNWILIRPFAFAVMLLLTTVQPARAFYEPNQQRWLNRDPIAENSGINLYAYVANNPINRIDPLGLEGNPILGLGGAWNNNSHGPGGSFYGAGYLYQPEIQPPLFNSSFSIGIIGTGSAEGGYFWGGGVTSSTGLGLFYNPNNGFSIGTFASSGAFVGGPTGSLNFPCNQSQQSGVVGKYAGFGGGFFASNAGSPGALHGPFNQWNINAGRISGSLAKSGDIWIGSLIGGPGEVAAASQYPTTTWNTTGFYLLTGQLTNPTAP